MKRTPLKRSSSLKKGGGLKKSSPLKKKPKTIEQKKEQEERWRKDIEFYLSVWDSRPHYCEACNKWLGNEMYPIYMDHLLEKSSHPELRYEADNIFLCCPGHHSSKTNGFPHPKHQEAINKAKIKYGK